MAHNIVSPLIILIVTLGVLVVSQNTEKKLQVRVYYETLCSDSRRFIKYQLYPTKSSGLGEYFDVEYVPYGKATHKVTETDSGEKKFSFTCQHGQDECDGNKMHACAIKYIPTEKKIHDFIFCSMSEKYPPTSFNLCARRTALGRSVSENIQNCVDSTEGNELLVMNGEKTHGLNPQLYFVPWVTINGKFSEDNLIDSQKDFKSVVCKELAGNGIKVEKSLC